MGIRTQVRKMLNKKPDISQLMVTNVYHTDYARTVLISYLIAPFKEPNQFKHQNYLTSHIVAESFSSLGFNVDVIAYDQEWFTPDYDNYTVIFGFGHNFERSFFSRNRAIPRIHLITGAHQDLHNAMSLKSINDFYTLSGKWLADEANVLPESSYYAMFDADAAIILARGYIYEDCQTRFSNKVYSLNNNILGVFNSALPKNTRTTNFLFLSGGKQITKGLPLLLEVARLRKDLNFYVVVPHIQVELLDYYKDLFATPGNVFLFKDIRMDGEEMKNIIDCCSYSLAPSYIDGLPGGTIEPMSAGLVPIVSRYCGFPAERFIFEMETHSVAGLNDKINEVLSITDAAYLTLSREAKAYADHHFSKEEVKKELLKILSAELKTSST